MIKKTFLLILALFLLFNDIPAHADKLTALRYKAMEEEMNKFIGQRKKAMEAALKGVAMEEEMNKFIRQRKKAMEAALKGAAQKIAHKKERFFFILSQGLEPIRPEKILIPPAQSIFPFRMLTMR